MKLRIAGRERLAASAGITLTEILIAIMILAIGIVSLATLFPIGLLRLREGARYTRSAYLAESAAGDMAARGLLNSKSFTFADLLNIGANNTYVLPIWYPTQNFPLVPGGYNPLVQDSGYYGPYIPYQNAGPVINAGVDVRGSGGYGLPFAYDPLWRFQTGLYPDPNNTLGQSIPEARFGDGTGVMRAESDGSPASAHGLQRLTNFNRYSVTVAGTVYPVMPSSSAIPSIFVSPEDYVWQDSANLNYKLASDLTTPVNQPSTVLPDLSLTSFTGNGVTVPQLSNDWRFSWMVTAQQNSAGNAAAFEGNIVVFENRPFGIRPATLTAPAQVEGETVVEAIYGYSTSLTNNGGGYGIGADRTVLLRWPSTQADPIVKVSDWFADVTYERSQWLVHTRFYFNTNPPTLPLTGVPNPNNNGEWDNLPAQRCFWYQVQKLSPAVNDPNLAGYRSMTVYVDRKLQAKTLLQKQGGVVNPVFQNAALICPSIINVIPQTFFVR
jgi:hypothetical protein